VEADRKPDREACRSWRPGITDHLASTRLEPHNTKLLPMLRGRRWSPDFRRQISQISPEQALGQLGNPRRLLTPIICRQQPRQIPFNFRASSFSFLAVSAAKEKE